MEERAVVKRPRGLAARKAFKVGIEGSAWTARRYIVDGLQDSRLEMICWLEEMRDCSSLGSRREYVFPAGSV